MKKLLLLAINARYTHTNLALRYLRSNIIDLPYQTTIKELSINMTLMDIIAEIWQEQPQLIAISVYIWNSEIVKQLLPEIKKIAPQIKIILGGPEVSYNPHKWLNKFPTAIDHIITGAGEAGLRYLLQNNADLPEKVISLPNPPFEQIKFAYSDSDFPEIKQKYIYYEASRGCPFKCSYCLSSRLDQKLEFRTPEQVKKEISYLIDKQPKIIKFVDRTFNADRQFARDIWQFLIEKNPSTKFHFEIHPDLLEPEDYDLLDTCPQDLFQFEIGIQSVNPKTLVEIHRPPTWDKLKSKIIKLIALNKFHIHVDLIAGLPYEDIITLADSFNEIYSLDADQFQLGFLKVLPGTEMAEKTPEYELSYINSAPYHILQNKWLSYRELLQIMKIENLLDIFYNSGKFKTTMIEIVEMFNTPFEFYLKLENYLEQNELTIYKDWQKNARILIEFINSIFPSETNFILDCLRWDWGAISRSRFYPDFLSSPESDLARENGYNYLKESSDKGKIVLKGIEFTLADLKRTILFSPSTEKFKSKYFKNNQIAAFIKNKDSLDIVRFDIE